MGPNRNTTHRTKCLKVVPRHERHYYTHNPEHQAVDQYQQTTEKLIGGCSTFKVLLKHASKNL
jgi:hypothetical protein